MSEETDALVQKVVDAAKAANARHVNDDGSPATEHQKARILIAQVHAILGIEQIDKDDPVVEEPTAETESTTTEVQP